MSCFLNITVGDTIPLFVQLPDGNEYQYPQAEIRDNESNLLTTLDLSHSNNGVYVPSVDYVMPDVTFIIVTYLIYTNIGYSIESLIYQHDTDIFYKSNDTKLNNLDLDVKRILGLVHENMHIDNPVYDYYNNLIGGRLRIYSDSASVGTDTNVIGTYQISSDGDGAGKFTTWKQTRIS